MNKKDLEQLKKIGFETIEISLDNVINFYDNKGNEVQVHLEENKVYYNIEDSISNTLEKIQVISSIINKIIIDNSN